uniref:Uncharacterized protein n=1 Tax=Candidatus Kentrum sp. LFY TaxID=2126342 RepID=A0A450W828_9GAMM|nr:MAG: hypothetical protein BECKLFY1418C_GA0070996_100278 [Candidatus Kentron sp. LFY]
MSVQGVECLECGCVRQVDIPFVSPRWSYTKNFKRYALDLWRRMARDVAHRLGVGRDTIKDIQARYLPRCFDNPKLAGLERCH